MKKKLTMISTLFWFGTDKSCYLGTSPNAVGRTIETYSNIRVGKFRFEQGKSTVGKIGNFWFEGVMEN